MTNDQRRRLLPSGFATIRDALTFAAGMVVIGVEVFGKGDVEPAVLAVGLTMTGLPLVFGADERRRGNGNNAGDPPPPTNPAAPALPDPPALPTAGDVSGSNE